MGEQIRDWVEEFSHAVEVSLSLPDGYGIEHKWTKKSIFWELEYWSTHLIRHNLDVMHIEKNEFDNIFNTLMDIKCKTKENLNARKDLKIICNRPKLEIDERRPNVMPKAVYTLIREQKMRIYEWITRLKFSDGYASNLARCVDMKVLRLHGMKRNDCHLFMQKLIPITFRQMLPESVWSALTEVLCKWNRPSRNDDLAMNDTRIQQSILNFSRRGSGVSTKRWLSGSERHIIEMYILTNCEVVTPYYESFLNELYEHYVHVRLYVYRSFHPHHRPRPHHQLPHRLQMMLYHLLGHRHLKRPACSLLYQQLLQSHHHQQSPHRQRASTSASIMRGTLPPHMAVSEAGASGAPTLLVPEHEGGRARWPPKQMEVFQRCYKKKEDGWSWPRAAEVAETFQKLMEDHQPQPRLMMAIPPRIGGIGGNDRAADVAGCSRGKNKGRVFGFDSEAHFSSRTYTSPSPPPPPNPTQEDRIGYLEVMMADMMVMIRKMRASSSVAEPSQPTASSTAPTQLTIDPQPPNDEEIGGSRLDLFVF
ncbi:UNVERIFIED_CONTAM: hypothetical protein Slati_0499900 [Sesamum latifolium]|uniref:Uncharacterized protein n=1 Tax=Sesamum latifolium TaxID=2727402 RepID=A0AAW2XX57_9LAMI